MREVQVKFLVMEYGTSVIPDQGEIKDKVDTYDQAEQKCRELAGRIPADYMCSMSWYEIRKIFVPVD